MLHVNFGRLSTIEYKELQSDQYLDQNKTGVFKLEFSFLERAFLTFF